jgi:predicted SAM-dependent methyltransferase
VTTRARKKPVVSTLADQGHLLKLDLGCGQRKRDSYHGVDNAPGADADTRFDLFSGEPWPFADNSVSHVHASHLVEHIPHYMPAYQGRDGFFVFFDEVHRICADGAEVTLEHPYAINERAFWDPTHTRYIHETTWFYLDAGWRKLQGLDHYPVRCDFKIANIVSGISAVFEHRTDEVKAFAKQHYWNAIGDLSVTLTASKPGGSADG